MTPKHVFVVDDTVMGFFIERSKREREDLLKIFRTLADSPYQTGEWLVSFWLDDPVLEVRIVDVKKIVP